MVVIMNSDATQADIENVIRAIEEKGLEAKIMESVVEGRALEAGH